VTIGAGFTHALCRSGAFKTGPVAIGAIAASAFAPGDVNQMKLLFQIELRDHAGQFLALPFGLRNAVPRPSPVVHRITKRPSVRRLERSTIERRNVSATVAMASDAGDVGDQGRSKIAPVVFTVTVHACQRGFQMLL